MTETVAPKLIIIEGFIENPQALFEHLLTVVEWDERISLTFRHIIKR